MKQTFLYSVWRHSKPLFWVMALFALGTLLCNLAGVETTPFFIWGMYSEKEQPARHYKVLQTTINDSMVVDTYDHAAETRFFMSSPLNYYKQIKDNGGVDPTISFLEKKIKRRFETVFNSDQQQREFMNWYRRYLGRVTGREIHSLRIDVLRLRFDQPQPVKDSVYLFERWEKP